ncbi:MAG: hypothetical protein JO307_33445 [Bryobacterales bacterium]|nr:hypothetical protein [Bryobacterales bacterium]MBV9400984.1 hypothetical protein [Bryobacterales bacterium]
METLFSIQGGLRRWMPIAGILAVSIVSGYPFLFGGMHIGHDSVEHLQRYSCVVEQFWRGEIYPRWLARMNSGLGSPIMFVYAPLPYLVPTLLRPLLPLGAAHNRESLELGISLWFALLLSGLTAFLWLRTLAAGTSALIAAIVYMLMPYHLSIDLYARDAVAEMWTFAWMPLCLYFAGRLIETEQPAEMRPRLAGLGLAISYALLIYTHLMITVLFTPALAAMLVFYPQPKARYSTLRNGCGWLALGLGLAAAYWMPAAAHVHNLSPQRMVAANSKLAYDFNFAFAWRALKSQTGDDLFLWKISWVAATTLAAAVAAFLLARRLNRRISDFWLGVAVMSLLMMLPLSRVVWKVVPALSAIQFPWRFSTTLVLAATALLAMACDALAENRGGWRSFAGATVAGIVLVWVVTDAKSVLSAAPWSPNMSLHFGDTWLPVWSQTDPAYQTPQGLLLLSQRPAVGGNWSGAVSIHRWNARDLEFTSSVKAGNWLTVRRLYYPGWAAMTANGRELQVRPSPDTGLVDIQAPAGMNRIRLALPWTWAEKLGTGISAVLLFFVAFLWLTRTAERRKASLDNA